MNRQLATHAAIRADRVRLRLLSFIPRSRPPHVVLGLEHQRAGRTDADAIAAIDARGFRQRNSRSEEHTSELQSPCNLVCRLLLEKKKQDISIDWPLSPLYTYSS